MSNTTIYIDSVDPYVKYGLLHFMHKYGFSSEDNPRLANIYAGYQRQAGLNSGLQIVMNSNAQERLCYLNYKGEAIPVFIEPVETSSTKSILKAENNGGEFTCVSIEQNNIIIGFDIFSQIGKILAGCYDNYFQKQDIFGTTLRAVPVVDVLEDTLFFAINNAISSKCALRPFEWPDGHKFALVVTHDVDRVYKTYQYLPSILKSLKRANISQLRYHFKNILTKHGTSNPYWTFDSVCTLDQSLGIKSTFYFLNETGRLNPFSLKSWILFAGRYDIKESPIMESIRTIDENGHEIGVHGSYNSFSNLKLLSAEKQTLESITNSEVIGIRQHHLNYDHSTPGIHRDCGFKYDTSIGFKPDTGIGFRRGTSFPFPLMLPDGSISPQLEIPLIIMDAALGSKASLEECLNLVDQVEKYKGVLTILWHNNSLNKEEYPALFDAYNKIVNKAKDKGACIIKAKEIYKLMTETKTKNVTETPYLEGMVCP